MIVTRLLAGEVINTIRYVNIMFILANSNKQLQNLSKQRAPQNDGILRSPLLAIILSSSLLAYKLMAQNFKVKSRIMKARTTFVKVKQVLWIYNLNRFLVWNKSMDSHRNTI